MIVEGCRCTFMAGASSEDIRLTAELEITGEKLSQRPVRFDACAYDRSESTKMLYSKRLEKSYLHTTGWSSKTYYSGIDFSAYKRISLYVSSLIGEREVSAFCGGSEVRFKVSPCDSFDDMLTISADLPEGIESDELCVSMPGDCSLSEIAFE